MKSQSSHSIESYQAVLPLSAVYNDVEGGSSFWVYDETFKIFYSNEDTEQHALLFIALYKVFLRFEC